MRQLTRRFLAILSLCFMLPGGTIHAQATRLLVYTTSDSPSDAYQRASFSDLSNVLVGFNVEVTDRLNLPLITMSILSAYDQFWLMSSDPDIVAHFSQAEIDAILAFRSAGGGVYIASDDNKVSSYQDDANQVSVPLGVEFSGTLNHGLGCFTPSHDGHQIFAGVNSLYETENVGRMIVQPHNTVVATYNSDEIIALKDDGLGRVVFDATFTRALNEAVHLCSDSIYLNNVANWLGNGSLADTISITTLETSLKCPLRIYGIGSFSQPIIGTIVPLSFDTSALFVDSVVFEDTCVSGWNLNTINISNDSGFLQVGLLNTTLDVIPPGICTLFTVFATPKTDSWPSGDCASAQLIFNVGPIDTALSGDPSRRLLLTDSNFNDVVPVFIKTDSVLIHNFIPGDATANGTVNISDVVFLINRIFGGGAAPCPECAGDADGSGTVNIADVTYLIARIFSGGPGPVCPTKCLNS